MNLAHSTNDADEQCTDTQSDGSRCFEGPLKNIHERKAHSLKHWRPKVCHKMDRSVGTLDAHKLKFNSHLDNISDDSLDDDDDDERSKELDGLLQNAFDDMSSIGDDEDPLDNDMRLTKHPASTYHRQHSPSLYTNEHNGNLIPSPQPSTSDKDSGTGKSESGLHLRLLLEENEKVSKMNEELKSQLRQSEDHVTQLEEKIKSLEATNQALIESKGQLSKELELVKATVRTFETQIEEMAKSEFLEDERNYYNRIIGEKETKFRDERLEWMDKVRNLTDVLETKDHQIERLTAKISTIDESKIAEDKRKSSDEIARLKDQLNNKEEDIKRLTAITRNMSLRIKSLERSTANSGPNSPSTDHHHTCSPHDILSSEHRSSPHRLGYSCQLSPDHNERREVPSDSQSGGKIFITQSELNNIKAANEKWRQETEQKYINHFFTQVEDLRKKYLIERDSWNSSLNKDVQLLATWIETLSIDQYSQSSSKQCKLLAPLRELWLVIETKFEERRKALFDKKHEIEEAMKDLEDAYNKSLEQDNSYDPTLIEELRDKLSETQEEVEMLKAKYQRYKRNYLKLKENTIRERDELKQQFAHMLQEARSRGDGQH